MSNEKFDDEMRKAKAVAAAITEVRDSLTLEAKDDRDFIDLLMQFQLALSQMVVFEVHRRLNALPPRVH